MTAESTDSKKNIRTLETEESIIGNKVSHHGFADASRRNRIEEQLDVLNEAARRNKHRLHDAEQPDDTTTTARSEE